MDQDKIQAIQDYLKKQFPDADHENKEDVQTMSQLFRIVTEEHVMLASVSRELIDDESAEVIMSRIERWDVVSLLKQHPEETVVVTSKGSSIVPR
ncbi:MAG: hypothetical protein ABFS32_17345 [Bacteroidota bacterium]